MYTSAGAGPVSLGLVTVLALLLTCREQCRGDMTHIHTFRTHGSRAHTLWLQSIPKRSSQLMCLEDLMFCGAFLPTKTSKFSPMK